MFDVINLDPQTMLETLKNPAAGLQLLAALVSINALLGVMVARKAGTFSRDYLLAFAESRLLYQLLPAALCGLAGVYLNMPVFLAVYGTVAVFMLYDLVADIKAKAVKLWTKGAKKPEDRG